MTTFDLPIRGRSRFTFWQGLFGVVMAVFAYVVFMRFSRGLGATTHLSDAFPWGLWVGFDVLCGVGLAAGTFTLMACVHLFHLERFEPIIRPTVLTGFLGYIFVSLGLMFDLGQPWRIWHALIYWNEHSVMFEVAWCVMLYTTVLSLEFAPIVFERLRMDWARKVLHSVNTPLVILGVLLSTLHQSSLGTVYLIVPEKLHPLWYTMLLPLLFYLSAIGAGMGMVIVESHLSGRAFGRELEMDLLEPLARAMMVVLSLYGVLRLDVLLHNGAIKTIFAPVYESRMFLLEFGVGVIAPITLLAFPRIRGSKNGIVIGATFAVLGFILYRLNVSLTGMERSSGVHYVPSWQELVVTVGMVVLGFGIFALAVKYLPIFPEHHAPAVGRGKAPTHRRSEREAV